jgi:hypothetical protein
MSSEPYKTFDIDVARLNQGLDELRQENALLLSQLDRLARSHADLACKNQQLQERAADLETALEAVSARCLHRLAGYCLTWCPGRVLCKIDGLTSGDFAGLPLDRLIAAHAGQILHFFEARLARQGYRPTFKGDDPLETQS